MVREVAIERRIAVEITWSKQYYGAFVKYYEYSDDLGTELGGGTEYAETDAGAVIRQIHVDGNGHIWASNISYPHWGIRMAEGVIDWDEIEQVTPIARADFDAVWDAHMQQRAQLWEHIKASHPPGTAVEGFIEILYPQGVIVNFGQGALGVADYRECKASTEPEPLSTRRKVIAVVVGYDENNQWLVLGSPQVYDEELTLDEMERLRSS